MSTTLDRIRIASILLLGCLLCACGEDPQPSERDTTQIRPAAALEAVPLEETSTEGFNWRLEEDRLRHALLQIEIVAPEGWQLHPPGPKLERMAGSGLVAALVSASGTMAIIEARRLLGHEEASAIADAVALKEREYGAVSRRESIERGGLDLHLVELKSEPELGRVILIHFLRKHHLVRVEVVQATEEAEAQLLGGLIAMTDRDAHDLADDLHAATGRQVYFNLRAAVVHDEARDFETGLGLSRTADRNWRFLVPGPEMTASEELFVYDEPFAGLSGRLRLVAVEADLETTLRSALAGIADAKPVVETIEMGDRSWLLATCHLEPLTLRFAVSSEGEQALLLRHITDVAHRSLGRDDALAFLGAVKPVSKVTSERPDVTHMEGLRSRRSGVHVDDIRLPASSDPFSCRPAESIPGAHVESAEMSAGRLWLLSTPAPCDREDALHAIKPGPDELGWGEESIGEFVFWRADRVHENRAEIFLCRRIGPLWKLLRLDGATMNEVSDRLFDRLRYLGFR